MKSDSAIGSLCMGSTTAWYRGAARTPAIPWGACADIYHSAYLSHKYAFPLNLV